MQATPLRRGDTLRGGAPAAKLPVRGPAGLQQAPFLQPVDSLVAAAMQGGQQPDAAQLAGAVDARIGATQDPLPEPWGPSELSVEAESAMQDTKPSLLPHRETLPKTQMHAVFSGVQDFF